MADKKSNNMKDDKKNNPSVTNDQLGENAGQGRTSGNNAKGGKCR